MTRELNAGDFKTAVRDAATPVLVDFYAEWCGPCKTQTPVLETWAAGNKGKVEVMKLNVDNAVEVASELGVMSIPTLILFAGGKEKARAVGFQTAAGLNALLAKA